MPLRESGKVSAGMRDSAVSPEEVDKGARLVAGVLGLLGLNFKRLVPQGRVFFAGEKHQVLEARRGGVGQGASVKRRTPDLST